MEDRLISESSSASLAALLPAWNPRGRLEATLESIVAQDVNCEIFVVDDGSQPAIELPAEMNGKPINLIRHASNQGISAALNTGLKVILERGFEYIARHDCGDSDHEDRLASQLDFLKLHKDVMLVGCSAKFVLPSGKLKFVFDAPLSQAEIERQMRYSAAVVHPSAMFRAEIFSKLGCYTDEFPWAEDYELFFRILAKHQVRNIPEPLVIASYNKSGISISHRRVSLISRLRLQVKYFDPASIHSYLGVAQTFCLKFLPYSFVSLIKSHSSSNDRE